MNTIVWHRSHDLRNGNFVAVETSSEICKEKTGLFPGQKIRIAFPRSDVWAKFIGIGVDGNNKDAMFFMEVHYDGTPAVGSVEIWKLKNSLKNRADIERILGQGNII